MGNFSYKAYAVEVFRELSQSNDKDIIYKFTKELSKFGKLKQFERYTPIKVEKII